MKLNEFKAASARRVPDSAHAEHFPRGLAGHHFFSVTLCPSLPVTHYQQSIADPSNAEPTAPGHDVPGCVRKYYFLPVPVNVNSRVFARFMSMCTSGRIKITAQHRGPE